MKKVLLYRIKKYDSIKNIVFIKGCVKNEIIDFDGDDNISLIINLAAIHREPGHKNWEYYETNLNGATNITSWADKIGCDHIIFSSSISPYGLSEDLRDENSLTTGSTSPYGGSKLVAEKFIKYGNQLTMIEEAHYSKTRSYFWTIRRRKCISFNKSNKRKLFFYMGNANTRKAGIYIKETLIL